MSFMQDNRILAKYKYVFLCVLLAGTPFGLGFGVIFGSARVGFAAGVLFGGGSPCSCWLTWIFPNGGTPAWRKTSSEMSFSDRTL